MPSKENKVYATLLHYWLDMKPSQPLFDDISYPLGGMIKEGWHEPHAEG